MSTLILNWQSQEVRAGKMPFGRVRGQKGGRVPRVVPFSPSRVPLFGLGFQAAAFG